MLDKWCCSSIKVELLILESYFSLVAKGKLEVNKPNIVTTPPTYVNIPGNLSILSNIPNTYADIGSSSIVLDKTIEEKYIKAPRHVN